MRARAAFTLRRAPLQPLISDAGSVSLLQALAMAPALMVDVAVRGPAVLMVLLVALASALAWETLFALARHTNLTAHGITTAMLVTLLAPGDVAAWQLAVAVSLGVVLGELVFGGRGFGFVQAATASLAMLVFSFPQVALHAPSAWVALALLPAALFLLLAGLLAWRILVAGVIACGCAFLLSESAPDVQLLAGIVAPVVTLLATDPVAAAATPAGRWVHGALCGLLVAIFAGFSTDGLVPEAIVFAALLASIFAPLIDHLVVLANAALRQRRRARFHG